MDWEKVKAEYIAGGTSYRKLAEKYGVSFSTLKDIAIREKWTDLKEQARNKANTNLVNSIGRNSAKRSVKINEVADKLLEKISNTLEMMDVVDSQSIKHFTSALKDIKDIKGVKSDIDLKEQEARIAKLQKDAEAGKFDEDKPHGVVLMPPIMDDLTPPKEDNDG